MAEEYSDGIAHVTTRQDFQLHFIHIEDTPSMMRRLAAVGITTREACGNTVRNVTACPIAGVCREQAFDVTPYAKATAYFLLGHPDARILAASSRSRSPAAATTPAAWCAFTTWRHRRRDRGQKRGFELYMGGGLGTVPQQAKLFDEFLPEEELLPIAQATARVFARLGEKKNRNTARLKFLVTKLGMDEFKRLVLAERATLPHEPAWTAYLKDIPNQETPLKPPSLLQIGSVRPEGFDAWHKTNVYEQRQAGYATVTVALPLGDITADQLRALADLARKYVKETIRPPSSRTSCCAG